MTTLVAFDSRTASSVSTTFTLHREVTSALFVLNVTDAAAAAGDLLDVYIQSSHDGAIWDDFVHFTQVLGNGGLKLFLAKWSRDVTPTTPQGVVKDGSLAAGVNQGPVGSTIRVKWVITNGGTGTQRFRFAVTAEFFRR